MSTSIKDEIFKDIDGCDSLEATRASITKILTRTERYQNRVRKHIEDNNIDFMPNLSSSDMFLEEGEALIKEADKVLQNVGGDARNMLQEAGAELTNCLVSLNEVSLGLRVSKRLLKIDDLFQCVEEANATKEYLVVLDLLEKLKVLIYCEQSGVTDADVDRVFQKCECFDTIRVRYHIQSHILQQNLQQRFEQLVQLNSKTFPNSKCVTLSISNNVSQLQDTAMALFQARYNPQQFCEFLLEQCIEPLILKPVSFEIKNNENSESMQISLSYSLKDVGSNSSLCPPYKQVLEHLKQLLQCLSSINVSVSSTQHVFSILGNHIKHRLLTLLVDECLMNAIPETVEEYQTSTLVEDVHQFEQLLADTFLINLETDRVLSEFTENYETYYRNRLFKRVLESAKEIMKKDLQDMVLVAERHTPEDIANNPFLFPRCNISKSTLEFIKLMERILRQPQDEDEKNSLHSVIAMMLDAYMIEVPKLHKNLLESIPQQSALFYNNCMFLAHWVSNNWSKGITTYPALVNTLQATGNKYLKVQIGYQQKILMDILNKLDLSDPHNLGPQPLKLIRQNMRQLELLKNVWVQVLPESLYNKTFCELLHTLCSKIIRCILLLEDISATVASELSNLIDIVLEKAPLLFKSPHEIMHVKSWEKFKQLKTILNASLKEITELWCGGVGLLSSSYKADEVKHLIRALFQNTDRRAKALMQIV